MLTALLVDLEISKTTQRALTRFSKETPAVLKLLHRWKQQSMRDFSDRTTQLHAYLEASSVELTSTLKLEEELQQLSKSLHDATLPSTVLMTLLSIHASSRINTEHLPGKIVVTANEIFQQLSPERMEQLLQAVTTDTFLGYSRYFSSCGDYAALETTTNLLSFFYGAGTYTQLQNLQLILKATVNFQRSGTTLANLDSLQHSADVGKLLTAENLSRFARIDFSVFQDLLDSTDMAAKALVLQEGLKTAKRLRNSARI